MSLFWTNSDGNASLDPYVVTDFGGQPYNDHHGRTQRSPVRTAGTVVVAIFGDSMSCGAGPTPYVPVNTLVQNFNICDSGVFDYVDPPLGQVLNVIGDGSIAARLGDALRSAGAARCIMAPFGIPSTIFAWWASLGLLGTHIFVSMRRLAAAGLSPDAVIFIGGPNDTNGGTSQASATASLLAIIETLRTNGVPEPVPIIICPCSTWAGTQGPAVRAAQSVVVNNSAFIYAGPDSDTFAFQADGTHHSDAGLAAFAAAIQSTLHSIGSPFP